MRRSASAFVVLAVGLFLLLAPVAEALPTVPENAANVLGSVRQQQPPPPPSQPTPQPAPDLPGSPHPTVEQTQRYMIGATGAALILLVLLTRRLRKKPVFIVQWKKKG